KAVVAVKDVAKAAAALSGKAAPPTLALPKNAVTTKQPTPRRGSDPGAGTSAKTSFVGATSSKPSPVVAVTGAPSPLPSSPKSLPSASPTGSQPVPTASPEKTASSRPPNPVPVNSPAPIYTPYQLPLLADAEDLEAMGVVAWEQPKVDEEILDSETLSAEDKMRALFGFDLAWSDFPIVRVSKIYQEHGYDAVLSNSLVIGRGKKKSLAAKPPPGSKTSKASRMGLKV
ncbi:unnamed protein product, partial [Amoebophrya sp. A25]